MQKSELPGVIRAGLPGQPRAKFLHSHAEIRAGYRQVLLNPDFCIPPLGLKSHAEIRAG
jgi:hypothetical protein